jgi:hypothetical protein
MTFNEICKALSIKPSAILNIKNLTQSHSKSRAFPAQDNKTINTDLQTSETTTDQDSRQYKYPIPKLTPDYIKNNDLSEEDKLRLEYHFRLAKLALHEFKNLMRSEGVDVSSFDISITNNRINYSKIPDNYRGIFDVMFKNSLSAESFKARGAHKSLSYFSNHTHHSSKDIHLNNIRSLRMR